MINAIANNINASSNRADRYTSLPATSVNSLAITLASVNPGAKIDAARHSAEVLGLIHPEGISLDPGKLADIQIEIKAHIVSKPSACYNDYRGFQGAISCN